MFSREMKSTLVIDGYGLSLHSLRPCLNRGFTADGIEVDASYNLINSTTSVLVASSKSQALHMPL